MLITFLGLVFPTFLCGQTPINNDEPSPPPKEIITRPELDPSISPLSSIETKTKTIEIGANEADDTAPNVLEP